MLDDLRLLFSHTHPDARREDYSRAIIEQNVLGKPTRKARELTLRHLATLYGLATENPIFRALRRLWSLNESAQPMLALAVSLARDPLLRATQDFILDHHVGEIVHREHVERFLEETYPHRFSPASLKSFAQNTSGSWTAGGVLNGHRNKFRAQPQAYPESLTLLLFLGYLSGRSGQRLFVSEWTNLLGTTQDELESLANTASHRGLLVFMNAGGVKEVRFPGFLTAEEDRIRQEISHVI